MAERPECERLRNNLLDDQNAIGPLQSLLDRLAGQRDDLLNERRRLENTIEEMRLLERTGQAGSTVFGPMGRATVSGLLAINSRVRIARLEGDLEETNATLARLDDRIQSTKNELSNRQNNIPFTREQLHRFGCALP